MRSTRCSIESSTEVLRRWARALVAVLALASLSTGHDLWIEPSVSRPKIGERVDIGLCVGVGFPGEVVARSERRILRFASIDGGGLEQPILGVDGRAPAGIWRPIRAGTTLFVYESTPARIELEAAKFEAYLAEEGLDHVLRLRREAGAATKPGVELYSRSLKALVLCSDPTREGPETSGFDRRCGLPFEIVPERDPFGARIGEELSLQVWYHDAPLVGASIGVVVRGSPEPATRLRTDEHGRVKIRIAAAGLHLVHGCWMERAAPDSLADWRSTWTSLTFDVRSPAGVKTP